MAILYYRDPGTGNWLPVQSSGAPGPPGPEEVIVQNGPPSLLIGLDIWIDPDEDPGSGLYADLAYVDAANTAQNSAINGKVAKAGDTMTGPLVTPQVTLNGGTFSAAVLPVAADGGSVRVQAADGSRGWVVARGVDVSTDPTAPTHLTNKEYVDTKNTSQDVAIAGAQSAAGSAQSAANTAQTAADGKVAKAGDAMTGQLEVTAGGLLVWALDGPADVQFGGSPLGALGAFWVTSEYLNLISFNPIRLGGGEYGTDNPQKITNLAAPTVATDATTKAYVDARIWFGTLAAYNAIGTKDPTVLYVVTG